MKVIDLINYLKELPPEATVVIKNNIPYISWNMLNEFDVKEVKMAKNLVDVELETDQ